MRNDLLLIIYKNMSLGDLLTSTNKKEIKSTLNCSKKKNCVGLGPWDVTQ